MRHFRYCFALLWLATGSVAKSSEPPTIYELLSTTGKSIQAAVVSMKDGKASLLVRKRVPLAAFSRSSQLQIEKLSTSPPASQASDRWSVAPWTATDGGTILGVFESLQGDGIVTILVRSEVPLSAFHPTSQDRVQAVLASRSLRQENRQESKKPAVEETSSRATSAHDAAGSEVIHTATTADERVHADQPVSRSIHLERSMAPEPSAIAPRALADDSLKKRIFLGRIVQYTAEIEQLYSSRGDEERPSEEWLEKANRLLHKIHDVRKEDRDNLIAYTSIAITIPAMVKRNDARVVANLLILTEYLARQGQ